MDNLLITIRLLVDNPVNQANANILEVKRSRVDPYLAIGFYIV